MSDDLFDKLPAAAAGETYDGSAIEVLEGLEPVRRRPGMYIGGTDERALHHLAAEVLDNAMDEAVAGHANRIEVWLEDVPGGIGRLTISDNGRGMPVDEHPRFPGKSALEVILTMLHSGGKFSGKAYATSGGLHGVGISVVNALSVLTRIEVARNKELFAQEFSRGLPTGPLTKIGNAPTGAVPRSPSCLIPKFSAQRRSSGPRGCSASSAPRPTCSPGWKSAGSAIPRWSATMCRPKRPSSSPAAWPITSPNSLAPANA